MKRKQISMLVSVALVVGLAALSTPKPALAAAYTWTGTVSTAWNDSGNWNPSGVPGSTDDVTIPGTGVPNEPTISSADVTIKSLTIQSGRTLTLSGNRTLTLAGNFSNEGAFNAQSDTTVTFTSVATVSGSGTFNFFNFAINASGQTVNVNVNINVVGAFTKSAGSFGQAICSDTSDPAVIFTGSSSSIVGITPSFCDLAINSGASVNSNVNFNVKRNLTNNGTLNVTGGTLEFTTVAVTSSISGSGTTTLNNVSTSAASKVVNPINHSMIINGNWNNPGTMTATGGTVTFAGTAPTCCGAGTTNFNNLTISSGTTLNHNEGTFNIAGNWTNNSTFTAGTGTVTFNGTGISTIGGLSTTAFNSLTINSGATVVVPDSDTPFTVAGTMTNNGRLQQTRTVNGANKVFLNISADKFYGVEINPGSANMGQATVNIKGNQACNTTDTLVHRCFDIAPTTAQNATIKFWYLNAERNNNDPASMKVYRWTGSVWSEETGTYTRGTSGSYEWVQVTDMDQYSVFGLDDGPPTGTPTAVTLSSFTAHPTTSQPTFFRWPWLALAGTVVACGGAVVRRWLGR